MKRDTYPTKAAVAEIQERLEKVYHLFKESGAVTQRKRTRLSPLEQSDFSLVWPLIARGYILEPHAFTAGASSGSRRGWIVGANMEGHDLNRFTHLLSTSKVEWGIQIAIDRGWMVKMEVPPHHGVGNPQQTPLYAMTPQCLRKWIHKVFPFQKDEE